MAIIAVTISNYEKKSELSDTFSISKYFLIHNSENSSESILKNPFSNELGGAGILCARFLIESKVDSIIVKKIGINPFRFLTFSNIKIYQSNSKFADEAITNYYNGKLNLLVDLKNQRHFRKRKLQSISNPLQRIQKFEK